MSTSFSIVSPSGEIIGSGSCSENQISNLAPSPSHRVFLQAASSATHYFDGENLVAYTEAQAQSKASQSDPMTTWSDATMTWVGGSSIEELRAERWAKLKARRDEVEVSGFVWDGSRFDSDLVSQMKITLGGIGAMKSLSDGGTFTEQWTLENNEVRELDALSMIGVASAMGSHFGATHAIGTGLRLAIEAALTKAEIEAISWPE